MNTTTPEHPNPISLGKKRIPYAAITRLHEEILQQFPPSVGRLYRWLLRLGRPGIPREIDLEKFREQTDLSWRTIRRALRILIEQTELVEQVHRFSRRYRKLIAWHPGRSSELPKPDNFVQKAAFLSKKEDSNPHDTVTSRSKNILKRTRTEPIKKGSVENDQGSGLVDPAGQEILRTVAEEIGETNLFPRLRRLILSTSADIVLSVIKALREQKAKREIKRQAGFVYEGLRRRYSSNEEKRARRERKQVYQGEKEAFRQWFDLAVRARVTSAFKEQSGTYWITDARGEWVPWETISVAFPKSLLERQIAEMPDITLEY